MPVPAVQIARPAQVGQAAARMVAKPLPQIWLEWDNSPEVATNLAGYPGLHTVIDSTVDLVHWQTWTNLPLTTTRTGPISPGRCWRVGYSFTPMSP
jgi:hypothetical protein